MIALTQADVRTRVLGASALLQTVAANSSIMFAAMVLARLMKLAFHVIVSRSAGVSGYGAYALGFNLLAFIQNFALAGADQTLVRFIPAYQARGERRAVAGLLLGAWAAGTIGSLVAGGLLFWGSDQLAMTAFHTRVLGGVLRIFAIALTFFSWIVLGAATAQALMRPRVSAVIQDLVFPAAALAALLAFGGPSRGLWPALWAFLCAAAVAGLLGALFAVRQTLATGGAYEFRPSEWSRFAAAMTVIEASAFVFTGLSPLVVAVFVSVQEAGLYNAALALVSQSSVLFAGIAVVVPATLAGLFARGAVTEAGALLRAVTRWLALLAQPFFIALVALGSLLLGLFGPDFRAGAPLLVVLAIGAAVTTVTVFTGYTLVSAGRQRVDMLNHLGLLGAALAGYPLAAAVWGVIGVAVFTAALNIAFSALKTAQVRWLLGINLWDRHLCRVLALGAVTLALYLGGGGLGMTATLFGRLAWLTVCLTVYVFGALAALCPEDRRLLRTALDRVVGR